MSNKLLSAIKCRVTIVVPPRAVHPLSLSARKVQHSICFIVVFKRFFTMSLLTVIYGQFEFVMFTMAMPGGNAAVVGSYFMLTRRNSKTFVSSPQHTGYLRRASRR